MALVFEYVVSFSFRFGHSSVVHYSFIALPPNIIQTIHAALVQKHWLFFMQHTRSFPHLLPFPTPLYLYYFPPKSTIIPAKNNMSVRRRTNRYLCHFRCWLGCEDNGRLNKYSSIYAGLRDELFWISQGYRLLRLVF